MSTPAPANGPAHDVLIVGGGLVGASLAIALEAQGLDVAMVEAGNVALDLAPMDVYETIAESVQMAASKARDTEVPIRVKCDPKIGAIDADQKRITQVIVNLLSNALRHTERGAMPGSQIT